jgi:hypothetical protein
MSVFDQMNVAADCRDILIALAMLKRDRPKKMKEADYNKAVSFIIASKAGMTPEVRERVINTCLGHVKRSGGVGWTPVLASEGTMQFDDIELSQIVTLLYAVFEHNRLIDFFSESPSDLDGQSEESGQASRMERTG